jgi:hypothetical protein
MSEAFLRVAVVWADPDLLDLEVVVRFQEWSGITRAYVSRSEVRAFAADLDAVVAGGTETRFLGGQRNLGMPSSAYVSTRASGAWRLTS